MIWKGSQDINEYSTSPEVEESATGGSITRTFSGPYQTILNAKPAIGSIMGGYSPNLFIRKVTTKKAPGGRGILTIEAGVEWQITTSGNAALAAPVPEIHWVKIEKPLAKHPRYATLSPQNAATAKAWAEDPTGKTAPTDTLSLDYAGKIAKGEDSYVVYAPVIRMTTEHNSTPTTGNCGKIDTPPISAEGSWVYLKTNDEARREKGRWSRVQEWTGADSIDTDIYAVGAGLP